MLLKRKDKETVCIRSRKKNNNGGWEKKEREQAGRVGQRAFRKRELERQKGQKRPKSQ